MSRGDLQHHSLINRRLTSSSMLHARDLASIDLRPPDPALRPRYQFTTVVWCSEDGFVYLRIRLIGAAVGAVVSDLLNHAYLDSLGHAFALGGDGLITHGSFTETGAQNFVFSVVW